MKNVKQYRWLAIILVVAGCSVLGGDDSTSKLSEGPTGAGVGQSGAQDFGRFRGIIEGGELPAENILDQVGFFSEHKIPLPEADCGNTVCMHGLMGVRGNMINGNNCTIVLLGLNTPLDPKEFERPPLNLAIAVDVSGSMVGAPIESVRLGLLNLVTELDPKDKVTLVTYSDEAEVVLESDILNDPDRTLLREAVSGLSASGGTNIYDGLRTALENVYADVGDNRQNRVILLSDGVATAGLESTDRIVNLGLSYAEKGIGITTIGVGQEFDIALMGRLAENGGNFYFLEDLGAVEEVFSEEIKTFLVPLAEDIEIRFDSDQAYSFKAAYGTRMWTGNSEGATIKIPSLFMAGRTSTDDIGPDGGRRGGGGMILLELTPTSDEAIIDATPANSELGKIAFTFHAPGSGMKHEQTLSVFNKMKPGETPEDGEFEDFAVEKAFVALNIYAGFTMAIERANSGAGNAALNILDPLSENMELWLEENPDEDIQSDLKTMKQLMVIIEEKRDESEVRIGQPADPWPKD